MSDSYQFYDAPSILQQQYQSGDWNTNDDYNSELPGFINDAIDSMNAMLPSWLHWNSSIEMPYHITIIEPEENVAITSPSVNALQTPTNPLDQDTNTEDYYIILAGCASTLVLYVLNTESNNFNNALKLLFH